MLIAHERLRALGAEILERGGCAAGEARLIVDHLVDANLAGHDSHGIGLLPIYVNHLRDGLVVPGSTPECVTDSGAILVFDGRRGFGRPAAGVAMAAAMDRCRDTGVVALALRNAHHIGRIGGFGEMAVAAGLVSIHFVNVVDHGPSVAPWGGSDARYVTNPVCIAVPGTEATPPTILDMATSKVAMGKIRVAHAKGEQVADGLLIGPDGKATTDPGVMWRSPKGALLPFGDHKGSGLALMCELLAGALTGGATIHPGNPRRDGIINNMFAVIVDPARLGTADWLAAEVDAMIAYVKESPPADPSVPVRVAGDPERAARAARARDGVDVPDATWALILDAGESVGLGREAL